MIFLEWVVYIFFLSVTIGWINGVRRTIDISYPTIFNTLLLTVVAFLFLIMEWNKLHLIWIYIVAVPLKVTSITFTWIMSLTLTRPYIFFFLLPFRWFIIFLSKPFYHLCKIGAKQQEYFDEMQ